MLFASAVPVTVGVLSLVILPSAGVRITGADGGVLSMVYTWPVKGKMGTSWPNPVSLTRFRPRVPSPVPVLAVTVHCVAGTPPTAVTPVMAGVPPSPLFTRVKLLLVRPLVASAKVTVHETEPALVGLEPLRLIEETVVSGRSTSVMVGSLPPTTAVSSVSVVWPTS